MQRNPTDRKRSELLMRQGGVCLYCKQRFDGYWQVIVEHKLPICRGGTNDMDNLAASCRPCDRMKGALTAEEFIKRITPPPVNELIRPALTVKGV